MERCYCDKSMFEHEHDDTPATSDSVQTKVRIVRGIKGSGRPGRLIPIVIEQTKKTGKEKERESKKKKKGVY